MEFEKYEDRLAAASAGGREGLAVRDRIMRAMPGEQKVAKSFELTELTRQIMRAGIRDAHPHASEEEIQQIYVARLLQHQGISLTKIRQQPDRKNSLPPSTHTTEVLRVRVRS